MPAFRLPDDGAHPVFKIPEIARFCSGDVAPMELVPEGRIRITYRGRKRPAIEAAFLGYVEHPYWNEIITSLRLRKDDDTVVIVDLDDIDTVAKLTIG